MFSWGQSFTLSYVYIISGIDPYLMRLMIQNIQYGFMMKSIFKFLNDLHNYTSVRKSLIYRTLKKIYTLRLVIRFNLCKSSIQSPQNRFFFKLYKLKTYLMLHSGQPVPR